MRARIASVACVLGLAAGCGAAADDGADPAPSSTEDTTPPEGNLNDIATASAAAAGCPSVTSTLAEHAAKGRAILVGTSFLFFPINVYYAASQAQNEVLGTDPNQRVTLYPLQYGFTADATRCTGTSLCTDGIVQQPEECDGADFGGATCKSLGYLGGGTLGCISYSCKLEPSGCRTACNNGVLEPGEFCDSPGAPVKDCTQLSSDYASGTVKCSSDCSSDTSACVFPICGDGVHQGYEQCDGNDLGPVRSCHEFGPDIYQSGTLTCTNCALDDRSCQKYCGNGVLDPGEQCDGALFAAPYTGKSCKDFEFPLPTWPIPIRVTYESGPLTCTPQCGVIMSACKPRPGCYSTTFKGRLLFECH